MKLIKTLIVMTALTVLAFVVLFWFASVISFRAFALVWEHGLLLKGAEPEELVLILLVAGLVAEIFKAVSSELKKHHSEDCRE